MKEKGQHLLVGGWCLLVIIGAVCAFSRLTDEALWYDEAYTAAMARHSIADILRFCTDDVHPPLYYLMTHMVCRVFGVSALTLRTVSVLGLLALACLGIGPVRRLFDLHGSLLFTALVFIMPISYSMGREARMYPWAWFFVTGSLLYAYLAVMDGKFSDWLRFGGLTILANYTHLYALLEMLILYALLFLWIIVRRRNCLKPFLLTAVSVSLSYMPWIPVILHQADKKDFWLPEPDLNLAWQTVIFPFTDKFSMVANSFFLLLSLGLTTGLLIYALMSAFRERQHAGLAILLAVGVIVFKVLTALLISFAIRPMFFPRHVCIFFGLFLLTLMYGLYHLPSRSVQAGICVLFIGLSLPAYRHIFTQQSNGPMFEVIQTLSPQLQPGDVFLHADEHSFGVFVYYFPEYQHYLYLPDGFEGYSTYAVFAPNGVYGHNFLDFIQDKPTVWLVNRLELLWVKFQEIPESAVSRAGDWQPTGKSRIFAHPPGWYRLRVTRFTNRKSSDNTR